MSKPNNRFEVVETFRDPDGVCSQVTRDSVSGRLSYRIFREFRAEGDHVAESGFFNLRHGAGVRRIIGVTEEFIMMEKERKLAKERKS